MTAANDETGGQGGGRLRVVVTEGEQGEEKKKIPRRFSVCSHESGAYKEV